MLDNKTTTVEVRGFRCDCGRASQLHLKTPSGFQAGGLAIDFVSHLIGHKLKVGDRVVLTVRVE